ncbi:MAG: 4-(cytidine 5'-diphospho)-2-C-methyl-D-erythritol kinase [Thiotrichaceae bacterium]
MKLDNQSLILPAPAKLNLFLHITGQREDGYHLLQTVFQFLDYSDEISLTLNNTGKISRILSHPLMSNISEDDDLTIKAARLLQQETGSAKGVDVGVDKILPMGGGLGGGSSDAATVLLGCNQLWKCGLSRNELAEMGLQLGADVPVFIHGFSAWAEGVGEQLTPIEPSEDWYVVIRPNVSISTVEIFRQEGLTRDCQPLTIAHFLQGHGINVLESEVRKLSPEVDEALNWLSSYSPARLTGSGSCIFSAVSDKQAAEKILAKLPKKWKGFVAKGMNVSPVESFL